MSVEAISWVLNEAPDVPAQLVSTLIGIANHATPDGRNAYPSQARLATYTRKSERQVRRDLGELAKRGLIRRGNQRIVEHLPQDRRPVVYDLAMDLDGGSPTSARTSTSARTPVTERGDMGDRNGGTPTSPKPSYEPSTEPSDTARPSAEPKSARAPRSKTRPKKERTPQQQARFTTADRIAHLWWDDQCPQRGIPVMAKGNRSPKAAFPGFRSVIEKALAADITETEIKNALIDCGTAWPTITALTNAVSRQRGRNPHAANGRPTNHYTETAAADSLGEIFG